MIVVDASVVIEFLRGRLGVVGTLLPGGELAIAGVTRAEILQGTRSAADVQATNLALDAFGQVDTPADIWPLLGTNLAALRRAGRPVPFQDVLLATIAVRHGARLWTRDQHFGAMLDVIDGLVLFEPPAA